MIFFAFIAGFFAIALLSWVLHALTHPVQAGQGVLIFLCKAFGVIMLLSAVGIWVGQSLLQAVPALAIMALAFTAANRLEDRWRSW